MVNRGFSGYTTRNFAALLPSIFTPDVAGPHVSAAVLFVGANDANDPAVNPWQAVPLEEFRSNLRAVLGHMEAAGLAAERTLVLPPPPSDPPAWRRAVEARDGAALPGPPKTNRINRAYYDAALEVAAAAGSPAAAFWDDLDDPGMFSDGLHFSAAGGGAVFK